MADYNLYQVDNVTEIAIPRPNGATWQQPVRHTRPNGMKVRARSATVKWKYDRLSEAAYLIFEQNRRTASQRFRTWRPPTPAGPAAYVTVTGIMDIIIPSGKVDGEYRDVTITWTRVRVL